MADHAKNKEKSTQKPEKEKKQDSGYVNWWLFRDKGTVAEPWPTAEELWKDPDVQEEIKKVRKVFNNHPKKKAHNQLIQKRNGS